MHDVKAIRETPEAYARGWRARGLEDADATVERVLQLDRKLRGAQTALQDCQSRRNEASKAIGRAKANKDEPTAQLLMAEVETLKGEIAAFFEEEGATGRELKELLAGLPNIPAADVPEGADESGNVEVPTASGKSLDPRFRGDERPEWVKDHADLGEALGMLDFEAAARMSGARFVVVKGQLARLERAIGQFMLDLQTQEHGYTEVNPPLLVRDEATFGTGQLPKFKNDLFASFAMAPFDWESFSYGGMYSETHPDWIDLHLAIESFYRENKVEDFEDGEDFIHMFRGTVLRSLGAYDVRSRWWLIPTAEVSLTNLVREQITAEEELPLRVTALTPCFRAEAGSAGRDTRGLIRQHQFHKVELVSITTPEQSDEEHERMTACAEAVLERLELPYRRMLLCTGDMGFTARKTYDLEVWLPSQGTYREISTCSNCGDFQARRMDARIRKAGEKGTRFAHTLNGSGLAVGRTLVAVMENYQDEDGKIAVPAVLQPYMGGLTQIG